MAKTRITITLAPEVLEAAKRRSAQSGVPVSTAAERLLAQWAATGELPQLAKPKKRKGV